MRKTFLKVALFSLVAAPMVTSLQSCKDYDDDITSINGTTGTLTSQIKDLEGQIASLKTALTTAQNEADAAAKDAENARKQAETALQNAAAAMDAARTAQAAGDAAKAAAEQAKATAAKAEADAAAALAMANEAKYAAAQAKADAIAEATRQAEALRNDIANLQALLQGKIDANAAGISENAKQIAINVAAIKANVDKLNALEAKINGIDAKLALYPTTEAMTKAINDAVAAAQREIMAEVQKNAANIADVTNRLNSLNTLITSEVQKLQTQIDSILADLAKNGGDITKLTAAQQDLLNKYNNLDGQINALTGRVDVVESDVAGLKADVQGINATLATIQATITDNYNEVLAKIGAVETRTTQIEAQLQALELYKTQLEQNFTDIANRFAAVEGKYDELKTELGDVKGTVAQHTTDIANLQSELGNVTTELNNLKGEFAAYKTELNNQFASLKTQLTSDIETAKSELTTAINNKIAECQTRLDNLVADFTTKIDTKLQAVETKINELDSKLNVLAMLPGRLTSVSFMPELYVDGVPTIEFVNVTYRSWNAYRTQDADKVWLYKDQSNSVFNITNNKATAKYRLNPESIAKDNVKLDALEYVSNKAVMRGRSAADGSNALKIVANSANIADGVLTLNVTNNHANKLNVSAADGVKPQITVAALKVPIADKYLYESEKETGAVVYSDYARVSEMTVAPELVTSTVAKTNSKLADQSEMRAALSTPTEDYIVVDVPYTGEKATCDLNTLLRAAYTLQNTGTTQYASVAELDTWGLAPEYSVINVGDYQYAKISGSTLTPVVPANAKITDVLGKTPVIAVALKNKNRSNNNVADVKYFMAKFVTDLAPVKKELSYSIKIGRNANGPIVRNIRWDWMTENILNQVATNTTLTKDEFIAVYGNPRIVTKRKTSLSTSSMNRMMQVGTDDVNAFTFTYTKDDLSNLTAFPETQTFTSTITYTAQGDNAPLYPSVTITYTFTVENPLDFKPVLGDYNDIYWSIVGGVQTIKAVPVNPIANPNESKPSYKTNLLDGRTLPYVKFTNAEANDSLNSIAIWNLKRVNTYNNLGAVINSAASIDGTHTKTNATSPLTRYFDIAHTSNGKELVSGERTIDIDWNIFPLGDNSITSGQTEPIKSFARTAVKIVKPLSASIGTKVLEIQDASVSTKVDLLQVVNIWDYYNNNAFNASHDWVARIKSFYAIDVEYGTPMINGSSATSQNINVNVVGDELVYDATNAPVVETDKVIEIPVIINHYWGKITTDNDAVKLVIKVTLKKKS